MTEEIRNKLYELSEEKYREFNQKLLPGVEHVLGVRLPILRKLAKEIAKDDFRVYLAEAQAQITRDSIHEEIMVQGLVIGYAKMEQEEYRKCLDEFVPKITNWSVCDSCVTGFKFMRKDPDYWFDYLKTYRDSKEEFEIRFMVVAMMNHFVDEEHIEEILSICNEIREQEIRGPSGELVRIEVFVHGALCVAVSGKCYMSLAEFNHSANRGECFQSCRRSYTVRDTETGAEFAVDNRYVMSPKDLCTIEFLGELLDSGASILKIEGRGRSADYVAETVAVYREAVDLWKSGAVPSPEQRTVWKQRLAQVFNRGFWEGGYYLGRKLGEWTGSGDNQATVRKIFLGTIVNYYPRAGAAEVRLTSDSLPSGADLLITGNTTGALKLRAESVRVGDLAVPKAEKGTNATFPCPAKVRENDKVYRLEPVTC